MELDWLKRWNLYSPTAVALTDGETGKSLTYSELYRESCRWAACLAQKHGVRSGDRVALVSFNDLDIFKLFFALHRLGACLAPLNYRLAGPEVAHILEDCQPRLVVAQEELCHLVPQNQSRVVSLESLRSQAAMEATTHTSFLAQDEDPALILYTSGTTGFPKGVIQSHRMLFWNSVNTTLRLNLTQSDRAVIFLPLFHTGGWNVFTTPFLHRGAEIILLRKFEADLVLQLTSEKQCTLLFGVPTTMDMMARASQFSTADLRNVRYAIVGGEPLSLESIETWHHKGVPVRQGYGLTEFGPNVFSLNETDTVRKMGSVGFPNFYVDVRVVDGDLREVPPGEVGELILKGPMMMTGYLNNPKSTASTIKDGWLLTGDLVRQDSEGYFYVVGRKKEMFISGGENVYPAEIERVLRSLSGVTEAAVLGVKDSKWGEVGHAFVAAEPGLTETQLSAHCLAHLAKFKVPKYFTILRELPKGDSGKISKKDLGRYLDSAPALSPSAH